MCDLSALEGAIVSAVDAAHLLERSKLAKIVRIQTSYVAVGPKRKKVVQGQTPVSQSDNITNVDKHVNVLLPEEDTRTLMSQHSHPANSLTTSQPAASTTPSSTISYPSREDSLMTESIPAEVQGPGAARMSSPGPRTTATTSRPHSKKPQHSRQGQSLTSGAAHKELRRARIVITVKRTNDYKKWLDDNPLQDMITAGEDFNEATDTIDLPPAGHTTTDN